jgi:hypothetical protein
MAEHKALEATHEFDAPPAPAKPRVVQLMLSHDAGVSMVALSSIGQIWERVRDPGMLNQPGIHWTWQRVRGPLE